MSGTVGKHFLRQNTEVRRNVSEVSDTRGNHDSLAADNLPVPSGELKTVVNTGDRGYFGFFESTYKALLKFQTVGNEGFNRNWNTHVRIRKRTFPAEFGQCKSGIGVIQAGGEAV